eukprot:5622030-Pleurochrysis_carterae.AAC.3
MGDGGWVQLFACTLARRRHHRASVRACARSARLRDPATFPYVGRYFYLRQNLHLVRASVAHSTPPSEGDNGYGSQPVPMKIRASKLVLRGWTSGE